MVKGHINAKRANPVSDQWAEMPRPSDQPDNGGSTARHPDKPARETGIAIANSHGSGSYHETLLGV